MLLLLHEWEEQREKERKECVCVCESERERAIVEKSERVWKNGFDVIRQKASLGIHWRELAENTAYWST